MTSLKKDSYSMMSLNFIDVPVWDIENPSMGHSLQEDKCSQKNIFFYFMLSCPRLEQTKKKSMVWGGE